MATRTPSSSREAALVVARATALLGIATLAGCVSYPSRTGMAMADFEAGRFEEARAAFEDPETTGSPFLGTAEAGMVALSAGHWAAAQTSFTAAVEVVREYEDRALVSATDLGQDVLSFAVNEGVQDYKGEGYERVLVHVALGLAYLAQGKTEDVWVEVQRSNALLESEQELYSKAYAAGGAGHFISAVAYELEGDLDDAYIDYMRMEEKGVGTELAGRALVRLGTILDREDRLPQWIERYGPPTELPEGAASVVLIAGVGLGPYKVEHHLTIPTSDGIIRWAVPAYQRRGQSVSHLELEEVGSRTRVASVLLEDVSSVAEQNLEDRLAWLAAKSAVRATLKYQLTKNLTDDHGAAGWIVGSLLTAATERADLRTWQTLPDSWHGARMFVAPGTHELALRAVGGERVALGTYELEPGETMFVLARTLGTRLYAHALGGNPVDSAPSLPVASGPGPAAAAGIQP